MLTRSKSRTQYLTALLKRRGVQVLRYTVLKLNPELGKRLKLEATLRGVYMNQLAEEIIGAALSIQSPTTLNGQGKAKAKERPPRRR